MKSVFVSLLLLVLMLGAVVWNGIFVRSVASDLYARLEDLPDWDDENCPAAAREIVELWESRSPWIELSVSYTVADRVSEQAVTLSAAAAAGDAFGFRAALALLRDAIGDMQRLERFSFANIL